MMGRTHMLTGVMAASGTAFVTGADVPSGLILFSLLPGFALFNDIDHPDATASRTLGGFTRIPALFMGHRRETHSLPGIAALALGTYLATINLGNVVANCWLTFVLVVGWLSALRIITTVCKDLKICRIPRGVGWVPVLVAVGVVWWPTELAHVGIRFPLWMLPWALGVGMLVHLIGDIITLQGCPLMWPFSSKKTRLGWFRTNGFGEAVATGVILFGIATSSGAWVFVLYSGVPPFK